MSRQVHIWSTRLSIRQRSVSFEFAGIQIPGIDKIHHSLNLKMAILDPSARARELNVIKFSTKGYLDAVTEDILVCLKATDQFEFAQFSLDHTFNSDVSFTLTSGYGPVVLTGQHICEFIKGDNEPKRTGTEVTEVSDEGKAPLAKLKITKRKIESSSSKETETGVIRKVTKESKDKEESAEQQPEKPEKPVKDVHSSKK